ncbi:MULTISPECIES: hypothetical protein [Pseudomonas]|uniref:Uncharacterized protein n=1 Tax=Pseudomonas fluorescens TaxID=294 RepID=A0A161ZAP0_PSEFL|nr:MULTISPECIES: hypothetical protein [Pseudomonas]KZN20787.1 hypothetical protein A1D17_04390 [Pseudomonas fluorescens]
MLSEARFCEAAAQRAVDRRNNNAANPGAFKTGAVLVSAMLAEGKMIDGALKHLNLDFYERMRYVEKNSEYIHSSDGAEAIQMVKLSNRQVLVHRLISPELRGEFQAHWLGVWEDHTAPNELGKLRAVMKAKLEARHKKREIARRQGGLDFGPDYLETAIEHVYPQG